MTETFRLADQIRRAFEGSAWHGDSMLELLAERKREDRSRPADQGCPQHLGDRSPYRRLGRRCRPPYWRHGGDPAGRAELPAR